MMFRSLRILSAFVLIALASSYALAGPGMIQYQGRLTDAAGNPIKTSVNVTFTFYSAATGGTQLGGFSDTDNVTPNAQGLYSTMIGDETGTKIPDAIFNSPQVWLNIKVGAENLTPRKQLVAVGYAFQSNWATTATTALVAKSASSTDTLATVTGRGASTSNELTLLGGIKTSRISPTNYKFNTTIQIDSLYVQGGTIKMPAITPPSAPASKIYLTSGTLFYGGAPVMLMKGENYVAVQTTSNPVQNGKNLLAAYALAKTLKPNGQDLATTNRLTVLVSPGRYDLSAGQFIMDTEFIDLIGLSSARSDQVVFGERNPGSGLLCQTANNVRIENLFVEANCRLQSHTPAFTYFPNANTTKTVVRNCEFSAKSNAVSMRDGVAYPGLYEICKAGPKSFGYYGAASGKFIDCEAGDYSFGMSAPAKGTFLRCTAGMRSFGDSSQASGTFTDCVAGGASFASGGTASGTFTNCKAGAYSFASNAGAIASGTFTHCTAGGWSFGYNGIASGTFTNCKAMMTSFGAYGTANGVFKACVADDASFGSYGTASGSFTDCVAKADSFGTGYWAVAGTASGMFVNCTAGRSSFGAGAYYDSASLKSTCAGTFINCVGGEESFGGGWATSVGARLQGCRMTGGAWSETWAGKMENCHWETGIKCAATARIYGSTFLGTLNLNSTATGVTQSRAQSITNAASNVFGSTNAAALNVASPEVK